MLHNDSDDDHEISPQRRSTRSASHSPSRPGGDVETGAQAGRLMRRMDSKARRGTQQAQDAVMKGLNTAAGIMAQSLGLPANLAGKLGGQAMDEDSDDDDRML